MKQQLFFIILTWHAAIGAVGPDDIFDAAENNNTKLAQQCINEYGVGILERRSQCFDDTPLHLAALCNASDCSMWIIYQGGTKLLELKDSNGYTPLHDASQRNAKDTIQFLLNKGANIQAINKYGQKPVEVTESDAIKELFIRQQKRNQQLLDAIQENNPEGVVQALSRNHSLIPSNGAQIDGRDENGRTALHHATLQGNPTFIKGLLGRNADPTKYDSKGELAVHIAAGEPERLAPFIEAAFGQRLRIKDR